MPAIIRTLVLATTVATTLSGCAYSWDSEAEGVPLAQLDLSGDAPTSIVLAGPDQVVITEGDRFTITVDGNKDAGAALRFDLDGDELAIARDSDIWDGRGAAIVRITMPAPSALAIAGSGSIKTQTVSSEAEIEIAGSGDIEVTRVDAESLTVDIAGSGDVTASGKTKRLVIDIAGAGNVAFDRLNADDVTVDIAGSGDVRLASDGVVEVDIVGSGDVVVIGTASCSFSTAGSGTVTCRPAAKAAAKPEKADSTGD